MKNFLVNTSKYPDSQAKGHRVVGAVEPVAAPGNARRYASNISSLQATASRARSGDGLSEKGY